MKNNQLAAAIVALIKIFDPKDSGQDGDGVSLKVTKFLATAAPVVGGILYLINEVLAMLGGSTP